MRVLLILHHFTCFLICNHCNRNWPTSMQLTRRSLLLFWIVQRMLDSNSPQLSTARVRFLRMVGSAWFVNCLYCSLLRFGNVITFNFVKFCNFCLFKNTSWYLRKLLEANESTWIYSQAFFFTLLKI